MDKDGRPESAAEIDTMVESTSNLLSTLHFHASYTVDDYPIGGRNRGKCRLSYERKKNEYRSVKETTNKHGAWCAPKKSVYQDKPMVVVSGDTLKHECGVLKIDNYGIHISYAADGGERLLMAPFYFPPQRERREYDWVTRDLYGTVLRTEHDVREADPQDKIDLWDYYIERYKPLSQIVYDQSAACLQCAIA